MTVEESTYIIYNFNMSHHTIPTKHYNTLSPKLSYLHFSNCVHISIHQPIHTQHANTQHPSTVHHRPINRPSPGKLCENVPDTGCAIQY